MIMRKIKLRDYEVRIKLHDTQVEKIHKFPGRNLDDAMREADTALAKQYGKGKYTMVRIMEIT
jgi:hypothetical protein